MWALKARPHPHIQSTHLTSLARRFDRFEYPNQTGPGVYDIHSPNVPTEQQIVDLMSEAAARIPAARLWVNPDCGLKTRNWEQVLHALKNIVAAAQRLRAEHALSHSENPIPTPA